MRVVTRSKTIINLFLRCSSKIVSFLPEYFFIYFYRRLLREKRRFVQKVSEQRQIQAKEVRSPWRAAVLLQKEHDRHARQILQLDFPSKRAHLSSQSKSREAEGRQDVQLLLRARKRHKDLDPGVQKPRRFAAMAQDYIHSN